jgi:hypothetical protein
MLFESCQRFSHGHLRHLTKYVNSGRIAREAQGQMTYKMIKHGDAVDLSPPRKGSISLVEIVRTRILTLIDPQIALQNTPIDTGRFAMYFESVLEKNDVSLESTRPRVTESERYLARLCVYPGLHREGDRIPRQLGLPVNVLTDLLSTFFCAACHRPVSEWHRNKDSVVYRREFNVRGLGLDWCVLEGYLCKPCTARWVAAKRI